MALPTDTVYITSVEPWVVTKWWAMIEFLIDAGATLSVLTQRIRSLNKHKKYVMGVSGKRQGHTFPEPLLCNSNGRSFLHCFPFVPDCPLFFFY